MKNNSNFQLANTLSVLGFLLLNVLLCSWTYTPSTDQNQQVEYENITSDTIDLGRDTLITFDPETYEEQIRIFAKEVINGKATFTRKNYFTSFDKDIFNTAAENNDQSLFIARDTIITFDPETFEETISMVNYYLLEETVKISNKKDSIKIKNNQTKEVEEIAVLDCKIMLKRTSGIKGGNHEDKYIFFNPDTFEERIKTYRYDR